MVDLLLLLLLAMIDIYDINETIVVYLGPNDRRIIKCNPSVPPMLYSGI